MECPNERPEQPEYQTYQVQWQGIELEIRHCPRWLCSTGELITQHVEVRSAGKVPLPITDTGYRSQFLHGETALAEFDDDPVAFMVWLLDEAAKDPEWKGRELEDRQGSLF
jgi:ribosomal protein S27AE